jgi:nucleoside-diphosphate-sugar epimerase
MRVLVTGGSGFLGSRVVPLLVERGHRVTALARGEAPASRVRELGALPIWGDLDDLPSLDQAFADSEAEALVNLASLGFGHAPGIVSATEEAGIRRAVFVSTTAVVTTLDAPSKAVRLGAERAIETSGLSWTILRPTMIYGLPGDRNMDRLLRLLRWTPVVPLPGGGSRLQQPVHVDDLARAVVAALETPTSSGRFYDVAGPEPLTLREIVQQAAAAIGRRPRLLAIPLQPAVAAARLYGRLTPRPRLKPEQLKRLSENKSFAIDQARADLGYRPRSFREGIATEAALLV